MDSLSRFPLSDGTPLRVRAIRPADAPALSDLITGLPAPDRWWRFHGAVNGVTRQRLAQMVEPQLPRQLALVALARRDGQETLVADARCSLDETGNAAEFGLMVASGWRRLGIGQCVLDALCEAAAQQGWRWLYGSVMADNAPMRALMQRCGFYSAPHRGNDHLVVVEKRLDRRPAAAALLTPLPLPTARVRAGTSAQPAVPFFH